MSGAVVVVRLLSGTYSSAVVGLRHTGGDLEAEQGAGGRLRAAPVS